MHHEEPSVQTNVPAVNAPPDWSALQKDLLCPLCRYNLRGLIESRCPECGFKFTWQELTDADQNRQNCFFEQGRGQNFKSFWRTYWRTYRPRRFWNDLSPAQPVQLRRLLVYWFIASGLMGAVLAGPWMVAMAQEAMADIQFRASAALGGNTPATLARGWPVPWERQFWEDQFVHGGFYNYQYAAPSGATCGFLLLAWPWLTLIALLAFRRSMGQAKIRNVHVLRTVVYSCDFGLLLGCVYAAACYKDFPLSKGSYLVLAALLCGVVTTYRLRIAFSEYLRVHLPLATVISSQLIAFLITFVALCLLGVDFSRQI